MSLICPLIRRDLSRYADAELSCRRAARVERHLAGCPACQRELDAIVDTVRYVDRHSAPEPPAGAWHRLQGALNDWASARRPAANVVQTHPFRPRGVRWAALLLLAAAIALASPAIYRRLSPRPVLAHDVDVAAFWNDVQAAAVNLHGDFARTYLLRVVSPEEARRACPDGKGPASEVPAGFTLTRTMVFETDCCFGLAAEYRRGEKWLIVVQIPSHHGMEWGTLAHEERRVGMTWCEVHEEEDLCSLVHHGSSVNVLVVGDSEPQFLGEVATFLATRAEGTPGTAAPQDR